MYELGHTILSFETLFDIKINRPKIPLGTDKLIDCTGRDLSHDTRRNLLLLLRRNRTRRDVLGGTAAAAVEAVGETAWLLDALRNSSDLVP